MSKIRRCTLYKYTLCTYLHAYSTKHAACSLHWIHSSLSVSQSIFCCSPILWKAVCRNQDPLCCTLHIFFYLYKYFNICLQIEKEENAFCHLLHRLILNCWIHFFLLRFSKALHLANRSHLCSWAFIILSNKIWKKKSRTKLWSIKLTDSKKHWQRRRTKKNIHRLSLNCGRLMQFIRFICYCFFF